MKLSGKILEVDDTAVFTGLAFVGLYKVLSYFLIRFARGLG